MTVTIIQRAHASYAEIVRHDGPNACRVGQHPYEDNSRNSVVCPAHRHEYQVKQQHARRAAQHKRKQVIVD